MDKQFNIRVYGIWLSKNRILVNEELVKGQTIIKFPGGGLNYGEGTIECLKREWNEELGLDIEVGKHFYTTDYFQKSVFDDSQVISIYYWVLAADNVIIKNNNQNERTFWININDVSDKTFTLPIDKIVGAMLKNLCSL